MRRGGASSDSFPVSRLEAHLKPKRGERDELVSGGTVVVRPNAFTSLSAAPPATHNADAELHDAAALEEEDDAREDEPLASNHDLPVEALGTVYRGLVLVERGG